MTRLPHVSNSVYSTQMKNFELLQGHMVSRPSASWLASHFLVTTGYCLQSKARDRSETQQAFILKGLFFSRASMQEARTDIYLTSRRGLHLFLETSSGMKYVPEPKTYFKSNKPAKYLTKASSCSAVTLVPLTVPARQGCVPSNQSLEKTGRPLHPEVPRNSAPSLS